MFCSNCGKKLPDDAITFCPHCGSPIKSDEDGNGSAPLEKVTVDEASANMHVVEDWQGDFQYSGDWHELITKTDKTSFIVNTIVILVALVIAGAISFSIYQGGNGIGEETLGVSEESDDSFVDMSDPNKAKYLDTTEGVAVGVGDTIKIKCRLSSNGSVIEGASQIEDFTLGTGSWISGFDEGLQGRSVGDTFDLDLYFPDDYEGTAVIDGKETGLAGLPVTYTVTILGRYDVGGNTSGLKEEGASSNSDPELEQQMVELCKFYIQGYYGYENDVETVAYPIIEKENIFRECYQKNLTQAFVPDSGNMSWYQGLNEGEYVIFVTWSMEIFDEIELPMYDVLYVFTDHADKMCVDMAYSKFHQMYGLHDNTGYDLDKEAYIVSCFDQGDFGSMHEDYMKQVEECEKNDPTGRVSQYLREVESSMHAYFEDYDDGDSLQFYDEYYSIYS